MSQPCEQGSQLRYSNALERPLSNITMEQVGSNLHFYTAAAQHACSGTKQGGQHVHVLFPT